MEPRVQTVKMMLVRAFSASCWSSPTTSLWFVDRLHGCSAWLARDVRYTCLLPKAADEDEETCSIVRGSLSHWHLGLLLV